MTFEPLQGSCQHLVVGRYQVVLAPLHKFGEYAVGTWSVYIALVLFMPGTNTTVLGLRAYL